MNIRLVSGTVRIADVNVFLKKLHDTAVDHGITIQALNADLISGSKHLRFAAEKAVRSFGSNRKVANNLGMEIMLYASGTRQIERALALGVREGPNKVAIVLAGEDGVDTAVDKILEMLDSPDPSVMEYSDLKKPGLLRVFEITPDELEAAGEDKIPELVLERVALVDILK